MSSAFTFGPKAPEGQPLGQTPLFGAPQQQQQQQQPGQLTFGAPSTNAALPQFASTFGTPTSALQFSSPATTTSFLSPSFNFKTTTAAQPNFKPPPSFAASTANSGMTLGTGLTSPTSNLFGNTTGTFTTQNSTPAVSLSFNTQNPSGGFAYGTGTAKPASIPVSSTGMFGAAVPTLANSGFPFGMPAVTTSAPPPAFGATSTASGGFNFVTSGPQQLGGSTFGTAAPTLATSGSTFASTSLPMPNLGLTFGTPTTNSGLSFGAPPTTNSGLTFGTTAPTATNLTFGTTAPTATNLTFGATAPTATNLTYGSTAPTATNLTFGTTAPTSTGLTLGTAATTAFGTGGSTGITFGSTIAAPGSTPSTFSTLSMPMATTATAATTGLPFGTTLSAPAPGGLSFATTTAVPNLNFTNTMASTAPTHGLISGAINSTTSSNLPLTSTNVAFGATPLPATAPLASFKTTATSLSFPGITSAPPPINFAALKTTMLPTVPAAPSTTTFPGTTFDLSLKPPSITTAAAATTSLLPTFASTITTASVIQPKVGLGGISSTPPKQPPTSTGNISSEQTDVAIRDQVLPNELLQSVDNFKRFVQEQKTFSSEIARFSVKELKTVEEDIDVVTKSISEMEKDLQKNKAIAEKLKYDSANALHHVEMAQRTFDTPSGLQYDNTAPLGYFIKLVDHFEKDMYELKMNIDTIDKCVKNTGPPVALSSQDLALGMRRLHETFVALAGRLQAVHNQVEYQKDQYLNLRKKLFNDHINVFEERSKELDALESVLDSIPYQPPVVCTGPTPFNSLGTSQAQALAQNPPALYPGPTTLGQSLPGFSSTSSTAMPLFGTSTAASSFSMPSSAFQLQKPPVGNKRGKP